jgi:hypothetical protein
LLPAQESLQRIGDQLLALDEQDPNRITHRRDVIGWLAPDSATLNAEVRHALGATAQMLLIRGEQIQ